VEEAEKLEMTEGKNGRFIIKIRLANPANRKYYQPV